MGAISRQSPPLLPLAQPWRRGAATIIDFLLAWLFSVLGYAPGAAIQWAQILVFFIAWWGLRVAFVNRNKGQSPGHWLMDVRLLDQRSRTPDFIALNKRELVMGICALLTLVVLETFGRGFTVLLLLAPVMINCAPAWLDDRHRALHDRFGGTEVYRCYRGFSLDRKLIQLMSKLRKDV